MPHFVYKIISDTSTIYYSDINFIQLYKYLTTGTKHQYKIYLTPTPQQLQTQTILNNTQLSPLLTNLSISTDFLDDNIEDISALTLLVFKLLLLYVMRKFLMKKLQVVVVVRKLWYWFAVDVLVALPFVVVGCLGKFRIMMGMFSWVGKCNSLLYVVLLFAVFWVFIINYINTHNEQPNHPNNSVPQKTHQSLTQPSQQNQQTPKNKIQNNHLLLDITQSTIIPSLIIIGNIISFFVFVLIFSLFKLIYTVLHYKYYSYWQIAMRVTISCIWVLYNLLWFAFYVGERYYRGEGGEVPEFQYCGYGVVFLLLAGGFVELISLVVEIGFSVIQCAKHLIKIVRQSTQMSLKEDNNQIKGKNHQSKKQSHQTSLQNDKQSENESRVYDTTTVIHTEKKRSQLWINKYDNRSTKLQKKQERTPNNGTQTQKTKSTTKIKSTKDNKVNKSSKKIDQKQNRKRSSLRTPAQVKKVEDRQQVFYVPVIFEQP